MERGGVGEVIPAAGEGELEALLLPEAEEDVEEGAAGRLVGLHEHEIHLGDAGGLAMLRAVGVTGGSSSTAAARLSWMVVCTRIRHRNPSINEKNVD